MADEQTDELSSERVIFPASKSLLAEVNEYRFVHCIDSKPAPVRRLVHAGLEAERNRKR